MGFNFCPPVCEVHLNHAIVFSVCIFALSRLGVGHRGRFFGFYFCLSRLGVGFLGFLFCPLVCTRPPACFHILCSTSAVSAFWCLRSRFVVGLKDTAFFGRFWGFLGAFLGVDFWFLFCSPVCPFFFYFFFSILLSCLFFPWWITSSTEQAQLLTSYPISAVYPALAGMSLLFCFAFLPCVGRLFFAFSLFCFFLPCVGLFLLFFFLCFSYPA